MFFKYLMWLINECCTLNFDSLTEQYNANTKIWEKRFYL